MGLKRLRTETREDAENLLSTIDRTAAIKEDDHDFPYYVTVTKDEQERIMAECTGTSYLFQSFETPKLMGGGSRRARFINVLYQFFARTEARKNWSINNYPILSHPWIHLAALFLELGLLIDLVWLNTFNTVPVMLTLAVTWGLHSVFKNPDSGKSAREQVKSWVSGLRELPFERPSAFDAVVVVVTLGLMLGIAIGQSTVMGIIGSTVQSGSGGGGHALADTVNPNGLLDIGLLFVLFVGFGIAEEVIFRHQIQRVLMSGSVHRRVWKTGMLFGLAHAFVYGVSLDGLTTLFALGVMGALMGYSYELTDNLTVPALAHGLNNALAVVGILIATGAV